MASAASTGLDSLPAKDAASFKSALVSTMFVSLYVRNIMNTSNIKRVSRFVNSW